MPILVKTLAVWLAMLAVLPAFAQETKVTLRAGEHSEFTRLVLSLPEEVSWRLDPQEAYIDLIIDDASISVDVSRTFERIPRTRLRNVDAMPTGVRLYLGCPCPLRIVNGFASQIVVDIVSPSMAARETEPPPRPRPRPGEQPTISGAQFELPAGSIASRAGAALAKTLRNTRQAPQENGFGILADNQIPEIKAPSDTSAEPSSQGQAHILLQEAVRSISGAVSQGILTTDPQFSGALSATPTLPSNAATHLRFETAPGRGVEPPMPQRCNQALSARIPDWSSPPIDALRNEIWATLYDPLDRIDLTQANLLASALLRAGFGAEARAVLALIPEAENVRHLRELSYIMDLEQPPQQSGLLRFADCSDMDTLWAFLAQPEETVALPGTQKRIVRAVQGLTPALRAHLGPTIVQNLMRRGALETARLVQAALERTAPLQSETIAKTTLGLLSADPATVADIGSTAWQDVSDAEFLLMLENANARELDLPTNALAEAISRQFALRRSELGRDFAVATAQALAQSDVFDQSFEIALSPEADLAAEKLAPLLDILYSRLATVANDTEFVTTVFKQRAWEQDLISAPVKKQLATRLRTLGFEREAQAFDGASSIAPPVLQEAGDGSASSAQPNADETYDSAQTESTSSLQDTDVIDSPEEIEGALGVGGETVVHSSVLQTGLSETDPSANTVTSGNGLLAQGRSELRQAAELRAQLSTLLGEPDVP